MLKIGVVIAVPLAVGFIAFPQFRATIVSLAPLALFALCPLGMLLGMKGMMGNKEGESCASCNHGHTNKDETHSMHKEKTQPIK